MLESVSGGLMSFSTNLDWGKGAGFANFFSDKLPPPIWLTIQDPSLPSLALGLNFKKIYIYIQKMNGLKFLFNEQIRAKLLRSKRRIKIIKKKVINQSNRPNETAPHDVNWKHSKIILLYFKFSIEYTHLRHTTRLAKTNAEESKILHYRQYNSQSNSHNTQYEPIRWENWLCEQPIRIRNIWQHQLPMTEYDSKSITNIKQ